MSWSKDQVILLIEEYQKYPCLYAVKSPLYKNKHARNIAIEGIEASLKKLRPGVSPQEIKNKFQALKTNFLNEHRKHVESLRSGAGQDQIYVPSLWYFQNMKFILDHIDARTGIDSSQFLENIPASQEPDENNNEVEECFLDEVGFLLSEETDETEPLFVETPRAKRKKKIHEASDMLMKEASTALNNLTKSFTETQENKKEDDAEQAFGKFIISKMRLIIDPEIKADVEEKIILLLFRGIRDNKIKTSANTVILSE